MRLRYAIVCLPLSGCVTITLTPSTITPPSPPPLLPPLPRPLSALILSLHTHTPFLLHPPSHTHAAIHQSNAITSILNVPPRARTTTTGSPVGDSCIHRGHLHIVQQVRKLDIKMPRRQHYGVCETGTKANGNRTAKKNITEVSNKSQRKAIRENRMEIKKKKGESTVLKNLTEV